MTQYAKSLLRLKPTYELITSKVLFSLGYATAAFAIPIFFTTRGLEDSRLGLFLGLVSFIIAIISLFLPPVMERFNQRLILVTSAFVAAISFASLAFAEPLFLSMLAVAVAQIALHINYSALIVLFRDSSRNEEEFTRDTGLLGSFSNLGWFLGPLLGGLTLGLTGSRGTFLLAGGLLAIGGLYVLLFPFKTVDKHRRVLDTAVRKNLQFFLSRAQLRVGYAQGLGVGVWWGFCLTFLPIFMVRWGYPPAVIGAFMALTQLPLFLLEFRTVRFVRKLGFRRIFLLSYGVLCVVCLASFAAFDNASAVVLGAILVASLSLSFLEPISNLFFFSKVSSLEEEKAYPIFVTADLTGSMLIKGACGAVLILFSDRVTFLAVGVVMLLIFLAAKRVQD
jgi:MFS family permease